MYPLTLETPQSVDPVAPLGQPPAKTHTFKMRLTADDAAKLKSWAHENELSQADFVRFMVFGRTSFAPPNSSKLEAIARQLVGIATNINQCQRVINEAHQSSTLTASQFGTMCRVLGQARRAFADPLTELRAELKKLKPNRVAKSDELQTE